VPRGFFIFDQDPLNSQYRDVGELFQQLLTDIED
jgi:hypothetical protein